MFTALKRLFSKPAPPAAAAPLPIPMPAAVAPPAAPPPPAPVPAAPVAVADRGDMIQVPLAPIVASLPAALSGLVVTRNGGTFSLPIKTALAQLPSGAVKVSFGELRQGSPPGTFAEDASQDRSPVNLPLAQILGLIGPTQFTRRSDQKIVVVPENVTSVFGEGRNLQAPVSAPTAFAPEPVPVEPEAPEPAAIEPVAPAPIIPVPAPVIPAPVIPAPVIPASRAPEPGASRFTRPPATPTLPSLKPKAPAPLPVAAPLPVHKPAPVIEEKEVLSVPLSALTESWPESLRQEIEQTQSPSATVALPMNRLETGLKAGRVNFTWAEVSLWILPPVSGKSSAHLDTALELPLKVIAPLFLAQRRPSKKAAAPAIIPDNVPDLFARTSAAPVAPVAAPAPPPPPPVSVLGEMFGVPSKTEWSPQEICQRIGALEGVAGSALAMSDGLLVAGQLPPEMDADTVSAFLPQIFGRVNQSAAAMQLDPVTSVILTAGQARIAVFKAGKLYLAVLGLPGAALPEAMLGRIAAETGKRNP